MRTGVISVLIIGAHILSATIFQYLRIGGIAPNFMIMIIVSFALLRGSKEGMIMGLFAGLLYDVCFGLMLGPAMITYGVIGYICGKLNKNFYRENFILPFICTFFASVFLGFIHIGAFVLQGELDFIFFFKSIIIPEFIYTITLSLLVYQVSYLINEKIEESEKYTRNIF